MENNSNCRSGLSFLSVLFLVFLVLKLTNVIDWSWWWVTAPLWSPIIILFVLISGIYAFYKILGYYSKNKMENFGSKIRKYLDAK